MQGMEMVTDGTQARATVWPPLLAILSVGLILRLVHFWVVSDTAVPKIHTVVESDVRTYWSWAHQILAGRVLDAYHTYSGYMRQIAPIETWYQWWGGKEIFRTAPLYPYWVAGLLGVSDGSVAFVLLVQLLVGAFHPLILFALARRLYDARIGLVAAVLTAAYGPFIFYQGVLLRDWLPPLLEPLALLALLRARDSRRTRDWLLAGAALGLCVLAKETVVLFLPLAGIWLLWEHWPGWGRAGMAAGYLAMGLVLVLSPLVLRNALVGAPLFSLSNRFAQSFIEANAMDGDPVGYRAVPAAMKQILERSSGKILPTVRETLRTYQGDYSHFLRKQVQKLRALADPNEVPGEAVSFNFGLEVSPVLRLTFRYGLIFPLGVAGFLASLGTWRRQRLLYLYLPAVVGGLLLGAIQERYRLILVPVILLYAAAALVRLFGLLREKRIARALCGLGLILGIAVAQYLWVPPVQPEAYHRGEYYLWAARVYLAESRFDRALEELERLAKRAQHHPGLAGFLAEASLLEGDSRAGWAQHLLDQGRRDEARDHVEERAEAAYASQLHLGAPWYNLGLLYLRLNETAKAWTLLDHFLTLEPEGPRAENVRRLRVRLKD